MRIISGKAKGKKLEFPKLRKGEELRPLTDRVREALFNILAKKIVDSIFLDLFAGTGAVGIEALSRGSKAAFFIDKNRAAINTIRENLEIAKFSHLAEVYLLDVIKAINFFKRKALKFDIIYIGTPYKEMGLLKKILKKIDNIMVLDGMVIAEHRVKTEIGEVNLDLFREERYGDTVLAFYRRKE